VSLVKSISPMQTDPPNLPPSPPADRTSPIVSRVLGFDTDIDTDSATHRMQPCIYPRVEDTCTVEHCPDANSAMEDAPLGSSVAESEDVTEIECTLWNASIGGCKDALPALRSSNEDEDEGGQEHHGDGRMCDDLSFGRVGSSGASHESDSNPAECSRQGNEEPHVEMEGHKAIDLVAHDVDPYKDAMRDDPDGGSIAFEAPQFQPQHSV
jgi:hypothetical protein